MSLGMRGTLAADLWRTCDRWYHIARYHRPDQLRRRAWNRVRDILWPNRVPTVPGVSLRERERVTLAERWSAQGRQTVSSLRKGHLILPGHHVELGWPIDWRLAHAKGLAPLTQFHLQYHEFLLEALAKSEAEDDRGIVVAVIERWLDDHGHRPHRVAWHPYCISRRLAVWAAVLHYIAMENATKERMIQSMASQARWLEKRLERDLGGNHLWENAKGLVIAGSVLAGRIPKRWLRVGSKLLEECIGEQILDSGEHFERCPSYQADLARGLKEAAEWIRPLDPQRAENWCHTATRMEEFLDRLRHPDGAIPLFGDSTLDAIESTRPLKPTTAMNRHDRDEWVGDYFVIQRGESQLIVDAGHMGTDELPAHAHADLLGFEMSTWGDRLLVDAGAYCYSGRDRARYRESRAHNVMVIDGVELADTWSSFRMGRRGHVVDRFSGKASVGTWTGAVHDAYTCIDVPRVTRLFFVVDDRVWFCVDIAQPATNRTHLFESFVHCAPPVRVVPSGDGFRLESSKGSAWWDGLGQNHQVKQWASTCSPRFYEEHANRSLTIWNKGQGTCLIGWCLTFSDEPSFPSAALEGDHVLFGWTELGRRRHARVRWREPSNGLD